MTKYKVLIIFFGFIYIILAMENIQTIESPKVTFLEPENLLHLIPKTRRLGFYSSELRIFCYRGTTKTIPKIFQTVHLHIKVENDDFDQYEGYTPEIVKENYEKQTSVFHYFFASKKTQLKLNPFNQTCIGIDTMQEYKVKLHVIQVDFWKLCYFLIGLSLFAYANHLSHNALFYYLSGILMGIFASLLILIYLASKLFPRRPAMYGVLICGWSLTIYLLQMIFENIQVIMLTYRNYVFWYVLITGFISFLICYKFGPPENQRSKDIIKWSLQLVSLVLMYYSSEFQEASATLVIFAIFFYYFPRSWFRKIHSFYIKKFPPKPRLLTEEEYYEQGLRETTKALEDLRKYVSSPECKQWHIVSRLKDPLRFASFAEGNSHISDQEILDYETSKTEFDDSDLSEDEENNTNEQNEENIVENISEDDESSESESNSTYNNDRMLTRERYPKIISQNGFIKREQSNNSRMFYSNYSQVPSISRTINRSRQSFGSRSYD